MLHVLRVFGSPWRAPHRIRIRTGTEPEPKPERPGKEAERKRNGSRKEVEWNRNRTVPISFLVEPLFSWPSEPLCTYHSTKLVRTYYIYLITNHHTLYLLFLPSFTTYALVPWTISHDHFFGWEQPLINDTVQCNLGGPRGDLALIQRRQIFPSLQSPINVWFHLWMTTEFDGIVTRPTTTHRPCGSYSKT